MKDSSKKKKAGRVYLVGAGPGDPELLTLAGVRLLKEADAVVYDSLINPALLLIAAGHAQKIYAGKDAETRAHPRGAEQEKINKLLVRLAREGKKVVRLKGGDPFIFGRGAEEASYLRKHKIEFEVVPGITAACGASAYAGIPVTDRRLASAVLFVTAHEDPEKKESLVDWKQIASFRGTIAVYMGVQNIARVSRVLIRGGMKPSTPVSIIERGTMHEQRVIEGTLSAIGAEARKAKIVSPAVVIIGEVNRLRGELNWLESRPLSGKTVLITRAQSQAGRLRGILETQGAQVLEFPAIEILPPAETRPLDQALRRMKDFDWMIFTSVNAVESVFLRMDALRIDARIFGRTKIAAIGETTEKALIEKGLRADLVPDKYTSDALVREFERRGEIRGKRFLLARTDIAPRELNEALGSRGGDVAQVTAYRTAPALNAEEKKKIARLIEGGAIDYITFTSASTVRGFFEGLPLKSKRIPSRLVSIGPVTSQTLQSYGYKPYREAGEHTLSGLVEALVNGKQ